MKQIADSNPTQLDAFDAMGVFVGTANYILSSDLSGWHCRVKDETHFAREENQAREWLKSRGAVTIVSYSGPS